MNPKTKLYPILTLLTIMLLVAAQCGAQPAGQSSEERKVDSAGDQIQEVAAKAEEEHDEHNEEEQAVGAEDEHDQEGEEHEDEEHEDEEHEEDHDHELENMDLSPIALDEGEKLRVVATTNIVADLVGNVGGELIDLHGLLPIGSDPHTFEPAPQDVTQVAEADVVFVNGLGLEEFLEELIDNAGNEAPVVALSNGIEPREFAEEDEHDETDLEHNEEHEEEEDEEHAEHAEEDEAHHDEHDEEGDHHHHGGTDAHIWMTPANAIIMVHNAAAALSALNPAHAETYEANAKTYKAELEALDTWVQSQIETIPAENRELVTDHDSFAYYAERYGLEVVAAVIPAYSTNAEPSARELARLQDAASKHQVKAIFVGTTVNPTLAERVAEDTGIQLIPLYTGSLGPEGSGAETYVDFIRYNTRSIVEGLR